MPSGARGIPQRANGCRVHVPPPHENRSSEQENRIFVQDASPRVAVGGKGDDDGWLIGLLQSPNLGFGQRTPALRLEHTRSWRWVYCCETTCLRTPSLRPTSVSGRLIPKTAPASLKVDSSPARGPLTNLSCRAPSLQLCATDDGGVTVTSATSP